MIKIDDKHNCCGCNACGDICPQAAIHFTTDKEGFWYPEVDLKKCVDCGLCERTCPFQNEQEPRNPLHSYAAINPDNEVCLHSSSGGIFSMLMQQTIGEGGVVFGAAFDKDWSVCHYGVDTAEDSIKFRGSKYVQSNLSGCHKEVQRILKQGRKVLFSGTACQVAGLKRFLGKEFDNLLTVDVVCHGVPSPGVWKDYVSYLCTRQKISNICFRDKRSGWKNYGFSVRFPDGKEIMESHHRNLYMQGYLRNLYLRPSCHSCKMKAGKCCSDITLGDFWGIEKIVPDMKGDLGVSLVLGYSNKGQKLLQSLPIALKEVDYDKVITDNSCIVMSTPDNKWRSVFMENYRNTGSIDTIKSVLKQMRPGLIVRLFRKVHRLF